jgi:hypothetical protein
MMKIMKKKKKKMMMMKVRTKQTAQISSTLNEPHAVVDFGTPDDEDDEESEEEDPVVELATLATETDCASSMAFE